MAVDEVRIKDNGVGQVVPGNKDANIALEKESEKGNGLEFIETMNTDERKDYLLKMETELLTGSSGVVSISEDDRRRIAVFSNGVCAISTGSRWSPDTKNVLTKVKRKGFDARYFVEVDTALMVELYERYDKEYNEDKDVDDVPEVERQRKLRELIALAAERKASDIHMRVLRRYTEIKVRVFGRVQEVGSLPPEEGMAMMQAVFSVASDIGENSSTMSFQQGALNPKSGILPPGVDMLRLQYSPTSEGRGALVARLKFSTPADEIEIDSLGYNDDQINDIIKFRRRTNGLYILAGKVSSGKTTTLQRTLNKMYLEKNKEISMFTIEEPVELELPGAIQCPVKKKPDGTDGFIEAMKSALRSDPNIIVVGEIRSEETAKLAIQAVMTGHALWSTVHAGYALGILDRLTDLGVESWKLEDPGIIKGLIYQRLCGVICKSCRMTMAEAFEKGKVTQQLLDDLKTVFDKEPTELYARGPGCGKCKMGLASRTVVAETIPTDPTLLELYSHGKRREMFQYWVKPVEDGGLGGRPVMHHALTKVGVGLLDIDEVEEEVDLVSEYIKNYSNLIPRLRSDVIELAETLNQ
jgi:general secretion pathway protein E